MSHALELPEDVYLRLQRVAEDEGVTPVEWIQSTISRYTSGVDKAATQTLAETLAPFIGAVDSSRDSPDLRYRSEFGDLVEADVARQGINPPQWER